MIKNKKQNKTMQRDWAEWGTGVSRLNNTSINKMTEKYLVKSDFVIK